MNAEWKASVSALLKKSRCLRKDMVKILTDDNVGSLSSEESPDFELGMTTDILSDILELKPSKNAFDTDLETINFILDDKLSLNELQVTNLLNTSAALISSEEEEDLSESGDPIHDASLINDLFYKSETLGKCDNNSENPTLVNDSSPIKKKSPVNKKIRFGAASKTKSSSNRLKENIKRFVTPVVQKNTLPTHSLQQNAATVRAINIPPDKKKTTAIHSSNQNIQQTIVHCLLMVPSGLGFLSCLPRCLHAGCKEKKLYLVCRMFWTNNVVCSNVCWKTSNPKFEFRQVAPVQITPAVLDRLRNNVMVIEVWSKSILSTSDEIIGICKLPLHLFYLTFRDADIADAFLRSKQPVIAVNDNLPVMDLFSGIKVGHLKVLLAMGKLEQVAHLQENPPICVDDSIYKMQATHKLTEHVFIMTITSLKLHLPPGSNIWGESDCHVQYLFPMQDLRTQSNYNDIHLSKCKSSARLCEPNIVFQSTTKHKLILPYDTPIQKCILQVFPRQGLPIQVWCKYYHPVECEDLVGETYLPLSKLCALTSLQEGSDSSFEAFELNIETCSLFRIFNPHAKVTENLGRITIKISYQRQELVTAEVTCVKDNPADEPTRDLEKPVDQITVFVPPPLNEVVQVPDKESCNQVTISELPKVEASTDSSVLLFVSIERGIHLSNIKPKLSSESLTPNCCVSLPPTSSSNCPQILTKVVVSSNDPVWNWHGEVSLSVEDLIKLHQHVVFPIWHIYDEYVSVEDKPFIPVDKGYIIGFASVDLSPLILGMATLSGWYNIVDFEGFCKGQIMITIRPKHRLDCFQPMLCNSHVSTKDFNAGIINKIADSDFPKYIANCIDQDMNCQTLTKKTQCNNNEVHNLSEYVAVIEDVPEDSLSFLMENLKEKLSNLDILQDSMEQWLSHLSKPAPLIKDNENPGKELLPYLHTLCVDTDVTCKLTDECVIRHEKTRVLHKSFNMGNQVTKCPEVNNDYSKFSSQHRKMVLDSSVIVEKRTKSNSRLAAAIFHSIQDNGNDSTLQ